jgi:hypothetical protein
LTESLKGGILQLPLRKEGTQKFLKRKEVLERS